MKNQIKSNLAAFGAGILFALGLGISGMARPEKVIGFLNITGDWDPSLAFVMVGGIAVHTLFYQLWLKQKSKPLLATAFSIPTSKKIDSRLVIGSAMFGIGWGLSGFCPGPALLSTMSFNKSSLIFVLAMIAGMVLFHFYERARQNQHLAQSTAKDHKKSMSAR